MRNYFIFTCKVQVCGAKERLCWSELAAWNLRKRFHPPRQIIKCYYKTPEYTTVGTAEEALRDLIDRKLSNFTLRLSVQSIGVLAEKRRPSQPQQWTGKVHYSVCSVLTIIHLDSQWCLIAIPRSITSYPKSGWAPGRIFCRRPQTRSDRLLVQQWAGHLYRGRGSEYHWPMLMLLERTSMTT